MMISPEMFAKQYKDKKYADLLEIRDQLVEEIEEFEELTPEEQKRGFMEPSPEVVYQMNLKYLGELCKLIADKYNSEYVWGEE